MPPGAYGWPRWPQTAAVRYALWEAALLIDAAGALEMLPPSRPVPVNPWHLADRFQLLVLIVLGESVARLISAAAIRPWRVPLAVVLAAALLTSAALWRAPAAFARERLARLLVPFAFGLVVLVPPMFYIERLGQPAFHQPYWQFWLSFVNVPAIARELLPRGSWTSDGASFDPAHLWFLYVLLLFTLALLPLFTYLGGPRGRLLTGALAGFAERHAAVVVLAAAIPMMAGEAAFGPDVNTGGWERVVYVFPFSYGFLIASDPRFENALRRSRWGARAGPPWQSPAWPPDRSYHGRAP